MVDSVTDFARKLEMELIDLAPGTLKPETDFRSAFDWNSINALIIMSFIQVEYRVTIHISELESCKNIQSIYDFVVSKVANKN